MRTNDFSYEEVEAVLHNLPPRWIPRILAELLIVADKKGCYKDGKMISTFIGDIERPTALDLIPKRT